MYVERNTMCTTKTNQTLFVFHHLEDVNFHHAVMLLRFKIHSFLKDKISLVHQTDVLVSEHFSCFHSEGVALKRLTFKVTWVTDEDNKSNLQIGQILTPKAT